LTIVGLFGIDTNIYDITGEFSFRKAFISIVTIMPDVLLQSPGKKWEYQRDPGLEVRERIYAALRKL
jgi:hypothetical protein